MRGSDRPPEMATFEAWQERVTAELGGVPYDKGLVATTREGLRIAPVYTERDWPGIGGPPDRSGFPGRYPFVRGVARVDAPAERGAAAWRTWVSASHWDLDTVRSNLEADVEGGAVGVRVELDRGARVGVPATGGGVPIRTAADLEAALGPLRSSGGWLSLDSGGNVLPIAALVVAWMSDPPPRSGALAEADRSLCLLGADPLGALAADGALPTSLDAAWIELGALGAALPAKGSVRVATVSTEPYVCAGADAAMELACALSAAVATLRALVDHGGLSIADATEHLAIELMVGTDLFLEIAKLRAARLCFAKLLAAYEAGVICPPRLIARTSPLIVSRRDPWVNILRATHATLAAAIGGAEAIVTASYDLALGQPDDGARRLARNTQHILADESHLGRVADPAGGSMYVEAITEKLARLAWARFTELERAGGLGSLLLSGELQKALAAGWAARSADLATRREGVVGVSEYPNLDEAPLSRHAAPPAEVSAGLEQRDRAPHRPWIESAERTVPTSQAGWPRLLSFARRGATLTELGRVLERADPAERAAALPRHRLAESFEVLRDEIEARSGPSRPRVFLANLGPLAEHAARAGWVSGLLAVGGIEATMGKGTPPGDPELAAREIASDLGASGASVACVCGADERYAEQAEAVIGALRSSGARRILFAGAPREREAALRAAGVDTFVFAGCDVLAVLRSLAADLEARS